MRSRVPIQSEGLPVGRQECAPSASYEEQDLPIEAARKTGRCQGRFLADSLCDLQRRIPAGAALEMIDWKALIQRSVMDKSYSLIPSRTSWRSSVKVSQRYTIRISGTFVLWMSASSCQRHSRSLGSQNHTHHFPSVQDNHSRHRAIFS